MLRTFLFLLTLLWANYSLSIPPSLPTLQVGSFNDQTRYAFDRDGDGPAGYSVDLIREVMKKIDRSYEIVYYHTLKDSLSTAFEASDVWISYVREPYSLEEFSGAYVTHSFGEINYDILASSESPYTSPRDLIGKRIILLEKGFERRRVALYGLKDASSVIFVESVEEGIVMLGKGEGDFFLCYSMLSSKSSSSKMANGIVTYSSGLSDRICLIVKDKVLCEQINWALLELRRSGVYQQIYDKWLGDKPPVIRDEFLPWILGSILFTISLLLLFIFELKRRINKRVAEVKLQHEEILELNMLVHLINKKSDQEVFMYDATNDLLYNLVNSQFVPSDSKLADYNWAIHPEDLPSYYDNCERLRKKLSTSVAMHLRIYDSVKKQYCYYAVVVERVISELIQDERYIFAMHDETGYKELIQQQDQIITGLNMSLKSAQIVRWIYDSSKHVVILIDCYMNENHFSIEEASTFFSDEDEEKLNEFRKTLVEGNESCVFLRQKLPGDDCYKPYEVRAQVNRNDVGEILFIYGISRDISEIYDFREQLTQKVKLLETIEECMPVGMSIYDQNGELQSVNNAMIQSLGLDKRRLMDGDSNLFQGVDGKKLLFRRFEDDKTTHFEMDYRDIVSYIEPWIDPLLPHGDFFDIRCTSIIDSLGSSLGYLSVCIDTTESVKDKQHILTLQEQMMVALDAGEVTIVRYCVDSRQFEVVYGAQVELQYKSLLDLKRVVPSGDFLRLEEKMNAIVKGDVDRICCDFKLGDKWMRLVLATECKSPCTHSLIGTSKEITYDVEIQDVLRRAKEKAEESERLKSAFLANMSHEIRTPLNAIVGFSELIHATDDVQERAEYVEIVQSNTEQLLRLIEDILDLSKIESNTLELQLNEFDVVAMLRHLHTMFRGVAEQAGLKFSMDCGLDQFMIYQDERRIVQIYTNFVQNALKNTTVGEIVMGVTTVGNGIRIWVKDSGTGIADSNQSLLFKRFEKVDSFTQGVGLGLAICKGIVQLLHGEIGCESQEGVGSTFWATIPSLSHLKCNA